jgi:DNA-binding helix-hairpin-helix protein with protein kinase domain
MSAGALLVGQHPVALGRRIGQGGEGEVYLLEGDPRHAVKLYREPVPREREHKVLAMIRAGLAERAPQVAFPLSVARLADGRFAGFMMRLVPDHLPLHELYSPAARRQHFPHADYRFIVRASQNIARAAAQVHALSCVIGDVNHSSILISRQATVALIDADSFQLSDDQGGLFRCTVGVAEYTPPELQGMALSGLTRTATHDAFGLAVVIFQLLFMGRHPFIGRVSRGDVPELGSAIQALRFAYTGRRNVGMEPPPGAPVLKDFPPFIGAAFEAAFGPAGRDSRPDAASWVAHLQGLEQGLVQCRRNALHWYPDSAPACLWCAMERVVATTLFPPCIPAAEAPVAAFDPGAGGFNLASVWGQIEGFVVAEHLDRLELQPRVTPLALRPARALRQARLRSWGKRLCGLAAGVLCVLQPQYLPLWVIFACGLLLLPRAPKRLGLLDAYRQAQRTLNVALRGWRSRVGVSDILHLLGDLRQARLEYAGLAGEERRQQEAYEQQRRSRKRHAFLEACQISHATIRGIGPHMKATLAAYGIETAAAIERARLLAVPGFGPVNSEGLLDWRRECEKRFVYDPKPNEQDRGELARISAEIQARAGLLRRTLLAGRANLEGLLKRTQALAAVSDPEIDRLRAQLAQARVNLEYMGGRVP